MPTSNSRQWRLFALPSCPHGESMSLRDLDSAASGLWGLSFEFRPQLLGFWVAYSPLHACQPPFHKALKSTPQRPKASKTLHAWNLAHRSPSDACQPQLPCQPPAKRVGLRSSSSTLKPLHLPSLTNPPIPFNLATLSPQSQKPLNGPQAKSQTPSYTEAVEPGRGRLVFVDLAGSKNARSSGADEVG